MILTSPAFGERGNIPQKYACNGQGISPPLEWRGVPNNTRSFALIVDDPDAPSGTFTHWVAFDITASQTSIPEGANQAGKSGNNSARKPGYTAPCPPSGTHRYIFTLYALDVPSLGLDQGASEQQVVDAMKNHILAQSQLIGLYNTQPAPVTELSQSR